MDLPPSMVKQKIHDYPRSIETASYMVASEWWESCGNSREEKYGLLLDTVRSMGKKCTAQRLENVVQESNIGLRNSNRILDRISSSQWGRQNPLTNLANNEIDNNNNTAVSGSAGIAGLDGNRGNLAICDGVIDPDGNSGNLVGNVGDMNIIEITDEEHGTQGQFNGRNSCEIQYSFPPSVENEAVEMLEGSHAYINFHEPEIVDRLIDPSVNEQPPFASNSHETEMRVNISQLKRPVSAKCTSPSLKCDKKKLDICKGSDSYVPMSETISRSDDPDVFGQVGTETENIESARFSKLCREVDVDDFGEPVKSVNNSEQLPDSDVWFDGSQSEDRMLRNDEESSEKGNFRKRRFGHEGNFQRLKSDDEDQGSGVSASLQSPLLGKTRPQSHTIDIEDPEVVDHLLPEVLISNAQSQDVMFQKPSDNETVYGNTGAKNRQTCAVNALTDSRNNDTGVVNGQIGEVVDQKGVIDSQTCVQNGQRGTENSPTGKSRPPSPTINIQDPEVVYHLLPEVYISNPRSHVEMFQQSSINVTVGGQTGVVNGQTGVVNGQTGVVNGQTGIVNGRTGVVNGRTGVVNGQTGVVNGQTGVVKDQTGVDNHQTCIVDDQIGVVDDQTGVYVQRRRK